MTSVRNVLSVGMGSKGLGSTLTSRSLTSAETCSGLV